ncbi:exodeoxyribonuclease V subunit beta [Salinisphaera sp. USBA-960]|uniref:exodeoxyribonuclease V subunit beta n=1 Tax=Salinisphaera orenii TaxID=856731 RepID=UPI000DBE9FE7|nr:exodeoxyribonuclease V subunit beta [Salifodinibacter halophilus]NNC25935.1 exodeoxyribonuclease V subunit beta [Salifodinibacter halophilus]
MSVRQSFDAATLPLHGLRLIEASAGTGKTFSLAGLYLRLIIEQGASVRDILVMTFTRAATQELRERIRARLTDAAHIAHNPENADPANPEHAFTQQILLGHDEPRARLAHRLADAAARVDEATIATIHGFAQRAAAENAFESALAFDRGEPVDDTSVYHEATTDYWREHVFDANAAADDILTLWPTPDALYSTLAPLLKRPHAALAGIDHTRLDQLMSQLTNTWAGTADILREALVEAFKADALLKAERVYTALAAADDPAHLFDELDTRINAALEAGTAPVLPDWLVALDNPASQFKNKTAHQARAEPLIRLEALPILAKLQPLAKLVAIERAAAAVRERAAQRKMARQQYSYDDLITALHEALTHERTGDRLADALHARWPYALVDEFQDTDPLQYASLRRIYLERPRDYGALLLIGDPKQAIYGFRGGDIYAYLAAAKAAGEACYTLTTNFRSTQGILDVVDALYKLPGETPFVVPEIDCPPVEAGRTAGDCQLMDAQGSPQPALTIWQLQGGEVVQKNKKIKNPNKPDDNARLIDETVAAIAGLLDGQSRYWQHADGSVQAVAPRDIVVLVNKNAEATILQGALAAKGIMAVCQHRDSVFQTEEANDLRLVLRAMAQPDDNTSVRAAQPTALIGKRLTDLVALADDDQAMQHAIKHFHALHEAWTKRGVLSALENLFAAAAPSLLALPDGERRMSNFLQLGELLADAESECFGKASLNRWLDDRIVAAKDGTNNNPEDDSQLRLESDADLVRISTVHAAKGLEYPIVFLPFGLWLGTSNQAGKPPLIFHPPDNATQTGNTGQAVVDLIGRHQAHIEQDKREQRSEALRLLYVALTRAEQALFVGWREPDDTGPSGALADLFYRDTSGTGDALNRLKNRVPDHVALEPIDTTTAPPHIKRLAPAGAPELAAARQDLPAARPRWSTYSFSRLAHASAEKNTVEQPEPGAADEFTASPDTVNTDLEPDGELPALDSRLSGIGFGAAVHDILETCLSSGNHISWPAPGEPLTNKHHDIVARRLRQYGLIDDSDIDPRVDDTAHLIARTLHTPLPTIGPLVTLDPQHCLVEMEFMLRLGGSRFEQLIETLRAAGYLPATLGGNPAATLHGLMQGFIDLVVEVDGRYIIIDYKTNNLGETLAAYRNHALTHAIGHAHYDLQYLIYTVALHRHLKRCLGASYHPATHLGGVQYLFVRAMDGNTTTGIFSDQPAIELIETLDALFDNATAPA